MTPNPCYDKDDKTHLIHRPINICATSPTPDKGEKRKSRTLAREPSNHIKRQGRARAREADHSNDHSRGRARRINNMSKEPQQKGGLKGGLKLYFQLMY